mmetsp:Transcript_15478/g.35378  ORF Transcript_15478/g.35378 Transcript_15478/m.35378 type:complete len:468 (+) Transcript_15478:89-1492(+)
MSVQASSALARKYELLQQRGKQRTPLSQGDRARPVTTKADIDNLKEYYLQRLLAKNPTQAAGRLSSPSPALSNDRLASGNQAGGVAQLQARGQTQRPGSVSVQPSAGQTPDVEELEVLCNNCFNLIKTSDAPHCTGIPKDCPVAERLGSGDEPSKANGQVAVLDLKLQKLRENITVRLASANTNSRVNIMRHLTQLRYHIDIAVKWAPGSPELSLSDHTIQQVKQLTQMARVLEPAIFVFSKRIENVILQKERELRKVGTAKPSVEADHRMTLRYERHPDIAAPAQLSTGDANSIIGDLESECGTNYVDTVVTQDAPGGTVADVAVLQEADDYLSLKNEDEQRKWFYSQCLAMKLACPDQIRARRILISDLYCQVRKAGVPMQQWKQWIKQQMPDENENTSSVPPSVASGIGRPSSTSGPCGTRSSTGRADVPVSRSSQEYTSRLGLHAPGPGTGGYPGGGGSLLRR